MKTLVVFYSRSGHSRQMAQLIASGLNADIDEIIDQRDRSGIKGWIIAGRDAMKEYLTEVKTTKNPSDYDLVIVGTPVWAGNSTPAVRTYVNQFKNQIKKVALFTTSGGATPEKTVAFLEKGLGQKSIASTGWTDLEIKNNTVSVKLDKFLQEIK